MQKHLFPWLLTLTLATMLVVSNNYTANLQAQGAVNPMYVNLIEILIKLGIISPDKANIARDIVNERVAINTLTATTTATTTLAVATSTATTTMATSTATTTIVTSTTTPEIGGTKEEVTVVTQSVPRRRTSSGTTVSNAVTGISLSVSTTTAYVSLTTVYATTTVTGGTTLTYAFTDSQGGLQATNTPNTYSVTFNSTGTHSITTWVYDSGVFSATTSVNISVVTTVPGAPTSITASPNSTAGRMNVGYTAPAYTGGTPITTYTVTSNPGSISTTTSSTTGAIVFGLSNGTSYTFTVLATNAVGNSSSSSASTATTTIDVPGAPTIGTASTNTPAQAYVTYTAPVSNGGSAITSYTVTSIGTPVVSTTTSSTTGAVVTGLTNGNSYTFTVLATNAVGNSASSSASNSVTPAAGGGGSTPLSCGTATTTGLISYWRAENNAQDSRGTNHGSLAGDATYTGSGQVGSAFTFDGSGDYVSVPDSSSLDIAAGMTVMAWIKRASGGGTYQGVVHKEDSYGFDILNTGYYSLLSGTTASGWNFRPGSNTQPGIGTWRHVTITYNTNGTAIYYIDGAADGGYSLSAGTLLSNSNNLLIGMWDPPNNGYSGQIDEVALFDRVLTPEEITSLYNFSSTAGGNQVYCTI